MLLVHQKDTRTINWAFFATNEARARQGAIELYMDGNGCTEKIAKDYYHWKVDVIAL